MGDQEHLVGVGSLYICSEMFISSVWSIYFKGAKRFLRNFSRGLLAAFVLRENLTILTKLQKEQPNIRVAAADSLLTTQICMPSADESARYEYHLAVIVDITENGVIEVRSFINSPSYN